MGLRVTYNGKDGLLQLGRETSPDNWVNAWTARERRDQTTAALLAALAEEQLRRGRKL
jgi:hypothetical protein